MKKIFKLIFVFAAVLLCFAGINNVNAKTTWIADYHDLNLYLAQETTEDTTLQLFNDIVLGYDMIVEINGSNKILDLNGHTITTLEGVTLNYRTSHTFTITDTLGGGKIKTSEYFEPYNYMPSTDPEHDAKFVIDDVIIETDDQVLFVDTNYFYLTINGGTFRSSFALYEDFSAYVSQFTFKKLNFELMEKSANSEFEISNDTAAPITDVLASGSSIYYVGPTGKAVLRNDKMIGTRYNGAGSVLITNEEVVAYHLITLHDGTGFNNGEQYILDGDTVEVPELTYPEGKTFMGWYTNQNYTDKYNFSTLVHSDIDLYAKWELTAAGSIGGETAEFATKTVGYEPVNSWSVPIFIDNEVIIDPARLQATLTGTNPEAFEFDLDTTMGVMAGPGMWNTWSNFHVGPKTGLDVGNYSAVLTLKYDQDNDGIYEVTIGTKQLLFKVVDKFTVSFNSNGGSYVEPIQVELNEEVTRPVSPEREGYIFDEWYTDSELTIPFSFGTSVTEDTTLYAKWFKDISSATVSGIVKQTYNGKIQRQNSLRVTLNEIELVKDSDYQVLYSNLTNAGTITITIKGIGNYQGTIKKTFVRAKAKNPLAVKTSNKTVYYSKVKKSAQVVKPITVTNKVGTLTYTKMSGSSSKLLLNKTTGKVTVKKGTKKGKYKIKIKVYASGNSNYLSNYGIRTVYITVK